MKLKEVGLKVVLSIIIVSSIFFMLKVLSSNSKEVDEVSQSVEALAYGEGPGDVNHRHDQAVNCPTNWSSWRIKPGCCWGYSTCRFTICNNQNGC